MFEIRLWQLYEWLTQKNIKPWEWDHDNYEGTPEKEAMIGKFYPEDISNIRQIDEMVARKNLADYKKQQSTAAAAKRKRF